MHPRALEALRALALRRQGCFTTAEARAAGITHRALQGLVSRGDVERVSRGVYHFTAVAWNWDGRLVAGLLAAGPEACVSHASAAHLLGLDGLPRGRPEVTVAGTRLPIIEGIRVHRTRALEACDVTETAGMRCTTGSRTLVDLAGRLSASRRVALVDDAICAGVAGRARLHERAVALGQGRKGVSTIAAITAPGAEGTFWSALERRFGGGIKARGLPTPRYNAPVRWRGHTYYADALWDGASLVAELHGLRFHRAPADRQRDDERFNAFTLAGLRCLVFTWRDVFEDMAGVAATIAAALAAGP